MALSLWNTFLELLGMLPVLTDLHFTSACLRADQTVASLPTGFYCICCPVTSAGVTTDKESALFTILSLYPPRLALAKNM